MATDEEKGSVSIRYITGFGELASLIASDLDHTTAVFKRFDKLAARDLLYYECELLELEILQDQYDREDAFDARRPDQPDTPASQQPTDLVSLSPQTHADPLTCFLK